MPKRKILLVEDEVDLLLILSANFKADGFEVIQSGTAEAGLRLLKKHNPDLVVSDISLPKMDGLEMLRRIRKESSVPVIFLTSRKDEIDRVVGLELGADDYVPKPFSLKELLCRVKAVLRRGDPRSAKSNGGPIRIGGIEIDAQRHEVRVNGKFCPLAPKEFALLMILVEADGKVLSREVLLRRAWGYEPGLELSTRTVDQHIARLRRRLLSEKDRVVTVKNLGYAVKQG